MNAKIVVLRSHEAEFLYSVTSNAVLSKCWSVIVRRYSRERREIVTGIPKSADGDKEDKSAASVQELVKDTELLNGLTSSGIHSLLGTRTHLPALTLQPPHTLLTPL